MKVEIDFDEALDQYVKEEGHKSFCRASPDEIQGFIEKLLDISLDHEEAAGILLNLIESFEDEHPGYIDLVRDKRAQREQDEKDMPGGFN